MELMRAKPTTCIATDGYTQRLMDALCSIDALTLKQIPISEWKIKEWKLKDQNFILAVYCKSKEENRDVLAISFPNEAKMGNQILSGDFESIPYTVAIYLDKQDEFLKWLVTKKDYTTIQKLHSTYQLKEHEYMSAIARGILPPEIIILSKLTIPEYIPDGFYKFQCLWPLMLQSGNHCINLIEYRIEHGGITIDELKDNRLNVSREQVRRFFLTLYKIKGWEKAIIHWINVLQQQYGDYVYSQLPLNETLLNLNVLTSPQVTLALSSEDIDLVFQKFDPIEIFGRLQKNYNTDQYIIAKVRNYLLEHKIKFPFELLKENLDNSSLLAWFELNAPPDEESRILGIFNLASMAIDVKILVKHYKLQRYNPHIKLLREKHMIT